MASQNKIPAGKKRIAITLRETTINRAHAYLGKHHQQKAMLSAIIDEQLCHILDAVDSFERMQREKGRELTQGDFLKVLGEQLSQLDEEQGKLL